MRRPLHPLLTLASALLAGGCFALGWDYQEAPPDSGGGGAGGAASSSSVGGAGGTPNGTGGGAGGLPFSPPVEIATGESSPRFLALDDLYLYWSNQASGDLRGIRRMSRATGEVITLAQTEAREPWAITVKGEKVYWVDINNSTECVTDADMDRLMAIDRDAPGMPAKLWDGCGGPRGVAVDDGAVYWTQFGAGKVMQRDLGTGTATEIATGEGGATGILVDESSVYWATNGENLISVYRKGSQTVEIFTATVKPNRLAMDADNLYWISFTQVSMLAKDKAGMPPVSLAQEGYTNLRGIAVDEAFLYFTENNAGEILRMPKDGSELPVVIASGQDHPSDIAVEDDAIYWLNQGSGQVMRQEKP